MLVVTLKSMLTQFQKEFWNRFTIPLVRLDSLGLARVRRLIPSNHNPFYYYDKTIISIDTLKGDLEYRNYLENAWWDIIIIDECHNVADRGTTSQRARLARLLAGRSDTLIMLSATPHDGRARSFASLVNMLDPTAISDPDEYHTEDFRNKGLVIRRFKKDIQGQVQAAFKERVVRAERQPASIEEEAAYEALLAIPFTTGCRYAAGKRAELVRITLQKALFSSPAAARQSVAARIHTLEGMESTPDSDEEITGLRRLNERLAQITPAQYGKYQRLLKLLGDTGYGWNPQARDDRLVIFSERIETLRFLLEELKKDLKLSAAAIEILHGGLPDTDQQALVESFGQTESPLRVLLCSDVAAEGLNLHYLSHRLIHFDMPWSLMVFQQRNGRVDRYGQSATPIITYLMTASANPRIRGDMRVPTPSPPSPVCFAAISTSAKLACPSLPITPPASMIGRSMTTSVGLC
jgi:SNF2 family DNA or RNA helicase